MKGILKKERVAFQLKPNWSKARWKIKAIQSRYDFVDLVLFKYTKMAGRKKKKNYLKY